MMKFVELLYVENLFPWLLNSLQNYLATPNLGAFISDYRERTWNGPETEVERTHNGITTEA